MIAHATMIGCGCYIPIVCSTVGTSHGMVRVFVPDMIASFTYAFFIHDIPSWMYNPVRRDIQTFPMLDEFKDSVPLT